MVAALAAIEDDGISINIEGGSTGYGDTTVLSRLNLRIDQDDRIALLGKNGQGKSTLAKLLSERLPLFDGRSTRASKLRVGYFAQHQVDELRVEETPLQHIQRERPGVAPPQLRAKLAGFGLGAAQEAVLVDPDVGGVCAAVLEGHGEMRPLLILEKVVHRVIAIPHVGITKTHPQVVACPYRSDKDIGQVRTIGKVNDASPIRLTVTVDPETEGCLRTNGETGHTHVLPGGIVAAQFVPGIQIVVLQFGYRKSELH